MKTIGAGVEDVLIFERSVFGINRVFFNNPDSEIDWPVADRV